MICGIYKIKNMLNGKIYIGQSKNIHKRWSQHKRLLDHGTHHSYKLQNAWNKYGSESFEFEIIERCDEENLNEIEIAYIKKFNAQKQGYNCTNQPISDENYINIKTIKHNLLGECGNVASKKRTILIPIYEVCKCFDIDLRELKMACKFMTRDDYEEYDVFIMVDRYIGFDYLFVTKFTNKVSNDFYIMDSMKIA